MPSPFPGMDPFLETPTRWAGVHQGLITYAAAALNRILPARYSADIGERLLLVEPDRDVVPDVFVAREPVPSVSGRGAGTALAAEVRGTLRADPHETVRVREAELREPFVEILLTDGDRRLVTTVEVLSPANKSPGRGREEYLAKQSAMLAGPAHLIEMDLLRRGRHTIAAPESSVRHADGRRGTVCLHRAGTGRVFELWPVMMTARLPRIAVPLAEGDADVVLDVQEVFDRMYDELGFARRMRYDGREPVAGGGFTPAERTWIEERIATVRADPRGAGA